MLEMGPTVVVQHSAGVGIGGEGLNVAALIELAVGAAHAPVDLDVQLAWVRRVPGPQQSAQPA